MDFIYLYEKDKSLAVALSGVKRGMKGTDIGGDVTNVPYEFNLNCPYESPLYNKYILI
jgi:hypothetical protein